MKLIVGLGNPGKQYEKTRHNVGFMVLDALREQLSSQYSVSEWQLSKKFNAEICGLTIGTEKLLFAKPMTFMNSSGHSVFLIAQFYKMTSQDLLIVHDDKDLMLGDVRREFGRGHAGHNGVRSIVDQIKTNQFDRIRVGVAPEGKEIDDTADFVLGKFGRSEKKVLKASIGEAVAEILDLL